MREIGREISSKLTPVKRRRILGIAIGGMALAGLKASLINNDPLPTEEIQAPPRQNNEAKIIEDVLPNPEQMSIEDFTAWFDVLFDEELDIFPSIGTRLTPRDAYSGKQIIFLTNNNTLISMSRGQTNSDFTPLNGEPILNYNEPKNYRLISVGDPPLSLPKHPKAMSASSQVSYLLLEGLKPRFKSTLTTLTYNAASTKSEPYQELTSADLYALSNGIENYYQEALKKWSPERNFKRSDDKKA